MFKKIIINIIFFLTGLAVMFCFVKACDAFLWFRPYLHFPLPSGHVKPLHLIAEGGPFRIYSSLQTGHQDFSVLRGNDPIVISEVISRSSNIYEIMYCENGLPVFRSRLQNKQPVMRNYTWYDTNGHGEYSCFDNNADGLWDRFFDEKNGKAYEWQNDRWFQIVSNNPITLGTNTFCMPTNTTNVK